MDWVGGAKKAFGIGKKAVEVILGDESKDDRQKATEIGAQMARMEAELEMHMTDAKVEMMKSQHAVQLSEIGSESRFKSFWRPLLGYGVTVSLCFVLISPTLVAILRPGTVIPDPNIDLMKLACLLLGTNVGFRSVDKAPQAVAMVRKLVGK